MGSVGRHQLPAVGGILVQFFLYLFFRCFSDMVAVSKDLGVVDEGFNLVVCHIAVFLFQHEKGVDKEQLAIFPKTPEKGIVDHIDYLAPS